MRLLQLLSWEAASHAAELSWIKIFIKIWLSEWPALRHVRGVVCCRCFYQLCKEISRKLGDQGIPAIFIGISHRQKAYNLWNENSNTAVVSQDVLFAEQLETIQIAEKNRKDLSSSLEVSVGTGLALQRDPKINTCPKDSIEGTSFWSDSANPWVRDLKNVVDRNESSFVTQNEGKTTQMQDRPSLQRASPRERI